MPTSTTNYGLIKPGTDDPILIGQLNDNADVIDATMKSLSDALDVAKLGIKYKGEVNYYSNLPATGNEIGDAYTVKYSGSSGTTPDGTEYVWGAVSGTNQWINFSKDSYTKAEVDALLSLKANTADIPTPSTAAPAMDGTAAAGTSTEYARADHVHPSDTSKQDALTTAQLAAVNSGIDSAKVAQIETNKTNILTNTSDIYSNYTKTKNKLVNNAVTTIIGEAVFTVNADKSVTAYTTGTTTEARQLPIATTSDNINITVGDVFSGIPDTTYDVSIGYGIGASGNNFIIDTITPTRAIGVAGIIRYANINIRAGVNIPQDNAITFRPMICTAADWVKSNVYFPHAMSNVDLTAAIKAIQAQLANT